MKRSRTTQLLAVLGLNLSLMVASLTTAGAQSQLELPVPSTQAPPAAPMAPLPRSQNSQTIPSHPLAAQPSAPPPEAAYPPSIMTQPVLPSIFRGCWRGEVFNLDEIQLLPGAGGLGTWTPKTYRVCYQRTGNGPFQLTFTEAGIEHDSRIFNAAGNMQLLSSDGHNAMMQASLHFDESVGGGGSFFGLVLGGGSFPVDETTKLRCVIEPDGMHVWATVYGTRDGAPWFRAHWHALFEPDPS